MDILLVCFEWYSVRFINHLRRVVVAYSGAIFFYTDFFKLIAMTSTDQNGTLRHSIATAIPRRSRI